MRKEGDCLDKEIMQGTIPGARIQGKPRMRWMDNMEEWTGMPFEDLWKETRDRRKWSILFREATNPRIEDGWRKDNSDVVPWPPSSTVLQIMENTNTSLALTACVLGAVHKVRHTPRGGSKRVWQFVTGEGIMIMWRQTFQTFYLLYDTSNWERCLTCCCDGCILYSDRRCHYTV